MNSETMPPLTLATMAPYAAEDSEPWEFRWDGRPFALYAGAKELALMESATVIYGDGGSLLEDMPDEDLEKIIVAWARWARHRRQAEAEAKRRREAMALVEAP